MFVNFISEIQDDIWKYFTIKSCIIKIHNKFFLAYLKIILTKEKEEKFRIYESNNSIFIIDSIEIKKISKILDPIINNKNTFEISYDNFQIPNISLELMEKSDIEKNIDIKTRSFSLNNYAIDFPCYSIIIPPNSKKKEIYDHFLKKNNKILLDNNIIYNNLFFASKDILNIEFGYPSISPHIEILVPIYIKTQNAKFYNGKFELQLDYNPEINKKNNILVNVYNVKENGVISQGKSYSKDLLDVIVFVPEIDSTFVKIELLYNEEVIEDFFQRIRSQKITVDEETQTKEGSQKITVDEETQTKEGSQKITVDEETQTLEKKKNIIKEFLENALKETNSYKKGIDFEKTAKEILLLEDRLKVRTERLNDGAVEIDILTLNYKKMDIWSVFDTVILIECKNTNSKTTSSDIGSFHSKLMTRHLKSGIFISFQGFTGKDDINGSLKLIRDIYRSNKVKIVILDKEDIKKILLCERSLSEIIEEKYLLFYN